MLGLGVSCRLQGITLLWVSWGFLDHFWNTGGIWQHMALQPSLCVCSPRAASGALSGLWELVREGCGLDSPGNLQRTEDTWDFVKLRLQFVMNLSWVKGRMG